MRDGKVRMLRAELSVAEFWGYSKAHGELQRRTLSADGGQQSCHDFFDSCVGGIDVPE
jgi:hypothetical protein